MNALSSCSPQRLEDWSQKLKVCGHPIRLKILCLIEHESICVSDLYQCLEQPQPVISQHLAVLKERGVVEGTVSGNKRFYSIVDPLVRLMVQQFLKSAAEPDTIGYA